MPFDLRTEIYDKLTGKLIAHQPYRRYAQGTRGAASTVVYERNGLFYDEEGDEIDCPDWIAAQKKEQEELNKKRAEKELKKKQKASEQSKKQAPKEKVA